MEENEEITYDVIQFIELPYFNIDKYVIVPHSWIRLRLISEGTVIVAYPETEGWKTYQRVRQNKMYKKEWKRYTAVVKYEANTFEKAQSWLSAASAENFRSYENSNKGEMVPDVSSSEEDSDYDDCVILIKEEPMDVHDDFLGISEDHLDNELESMNDYVPLDRNDHITGDDANNLIPKINIEETITNISNTNENVINDCAAPIDSEANNHVATRNDNNTIGDYIAPINRTVRDFNNPISNNIDDGVPLAHNNDPVDYIVQECSSGVPSGLINNTNDCAVLFSNNDIEIRAAPSTCNDTVDKVTPSNDIAAGNRDALINNNEADNETELINDGGADQHLTSINIEENMNNDDDFLETRTAVNQISGGLALMNDNVHLEHGDHNICGNVNNLVSKTNIEKTITNVSKTNGSNTDNYGAPIIHNDTNIHVATSNDNNTGNCDSAHNNDDVCSYSTDDYVAPINDTVRGDCVPVSNNITYGVTQVHNNEPVDIIAQDRDNDKDDVAPGLNNNTYDFAAPFNNKDAESYAAPGNCNDAKYDVAPNNDKATSAGVAPINNNEAGNDTALMNDGGGNQYLSPMDIEENINNNESTQNLLNEASTTQNFIQTGRPHSVIIFDRSKLLATRKKASSAVICDDTPSTTVSKPQMTVMPLRNTNNEIAQEKSARELNKKQKVIENDLEAAFDKLNNFNNIKKQAYSSSNDSIHQPSDLEIKMETLIANNVVHQLAYSKSTKNVRPVTSSEKLISLKKITSPVSVNYWTQNHNNTLFVSPFVQSTTKTPFSNTFQANMTSPNENVRLTQSEPSRYLPVVSHENDSRVESVRQNVVSQINNVVQSSDSQNTVSIQYLTKKPIQSKHKFGQKITYSNKNLRFDKEHLNVSRSGYNNLPVTSTYNNYSGLETIRPEKSEQIHFNYEKAYTQSLRNTVSSQHFTEQSTHRISNSDPQMTSSNTVVDHQPTEQATNSTIHSIIIQEAPQNKNIGPKYRKRMKKKSLEQSQENSKIQEPILQSATNHQLPSMQNSFITTTQHWELSQNSAFQRHVSNQPRVARVAQVPVATHIESNLMQLQNGFQYNMTRSSAVQNRNHSNPEKQPRQVIIPFVSNSLAHNTPIAFANSAQAPHTQSMSTAIPTVADNMHLGPHFQGYVSNTSVNTSNFENRVVPFPEQISTGSHGAQGTYTNGFYLRKPSNSYSYDQRTSIQSSSMNIPVVAQQYPASQHLNQYSGHFTGQQNVQNYQKGPNHETGMQNVYTGRPSTNNSFNPQLYYQHSENSQNNASFTPFHPSIQITQGHCTNSCCHQHVDKSPVIQSNTYQKVNENAQYAEENGLNSLTSSTTHPSEYCEQSQIATQPQNSSNIISLPNHTENSPNSTKKYQYLTNQAKPYIKKEPLSPISVDSSDESTTKSNIIKKCVPEKSENNMNYENSNRISPICVDSSDEEILTKEITAENSKNKVQEINPKNDEYTLARRTALKRIKAHIEKMNSASEKTYSSLQTVYDPHGGEIDTWKKLQKIINILVDHKINECESVVKSHLRNKNKEKNKEQDICLDNEQSSDEENNDEDYVQPTKKKPSNIATKSQDTKWTLRYQMPSPELTELITKSKVFVSRVALDNCKRLARDHTTLARMLIDEVYNEEALKNCSLTKKVPVLDAHALKTIIKYVKCHGDIEDWGLIDLVGVKKSMRNRLMVHRRHKAASSSALS